MLFLSFRLADTVVGGRQSAAAAAAAGLRLVLEGGLLQLLERLLDDRGSARRLRRTAGGRRPVGDSGRRLGAQTVPGHGQAQTSVHGLDLTQLCGLELLRWRLDDLPLGSSLILRFKVHTFVTCGEERGPLRLVLFICSDDGLFFPGCNTPCLVV